MGDFTWTLFEYTSGGNPYIAKTGKERDRIIRKYERMGIEVEFVSWSGIRRYIIHDREGRKE